MYLKVAHNVHQIHQTLQIHQVACVKRVIFTIRHQKTVLLVILNVILAHFNLTTALRVHQQPKINKALQAAETV
jgi:uncharacterized protein YccT (UPF0319 family)